MFCSVVKGQGGHHWTQQFGESSMFLGGSVIGGVTDLGAVYYNPGRISQLKGKIFVFSGNAYELNTLKINDLVGKKGFTSSKFKGVPSITAGTFKIKFLKNHYFAWAVLVKNDIDLDINLTSDKYEDVFSATSGKEYFNSSMNLVKKLRNTWSCLCWSYPVCDRLSIGLTGIYSHISNEKTANLDMAVLAEDEGNTSVYSYKKGYNYTYNGLHFKAGLSYKYSKGLIGLTLLTPIQKLKGTGGFKNKIYSSGVSAFTDNSDIFSYTNQSDIDAEYRSPWAVGMGISYHLPKTVVHLGVEWYSNVPSYNVLIPHDYEVQSSGKQESYSVTDNQKSILNYGVGFEFYFSDKVEAYASFCTDYSSIEKSSGNDNAAALNPINDDYFNIGGGVKLKFKATSLSLGFAHTGAKSSVYRPVDIPSVDWIIGSGNEDNTSIKWDRWRLMVSLSVPLWENIKEEIGF